MVHFIIQGYVGDFDIYRNIGLMESKKVHGEFGILTAVASVLSLTLTIKQTPQSIFSHFPTSLFVFFSNPVHSFFFLRNLYVFVSDTVFNISWEDLVRLGVIYFYWKK